MRRTSLVMALACVLTLVAATGSSISAEPKKEFLTLFRQPEGFPAHQAIARLSPATLAALRGMGHGAESGSESASEAVAGPDVRTTNSGGTQSEISMAATAGGQNIVLAYNGGPNGLGVTSSQDGGPTFGAEYSAPVPAGSNPCCDPSVVGDGGNSFYLIQLYRDDGANTPAAGNCTNSLHISTDGGQTFGNIVSSPFQYPPGPAFPDQPHIGIDRNNGDLWVTTRDFTSGINCPQSGGSGTVQGEIVCSNDGGTTWSNPLVWSPFTDTAHIGVAPDGTVYVAGMGVGTNMGTNRVILWRSSAACPGAGNTPTFTGPTVVADNLTFGASGIDREFVQPDVIVDPTNSNRVFVSYSADSTQGSGDREVWLGTCTFPAGTCTNVTVNDNGGDGTPQYFIQTCVDPTSNAIHASWTDAGPAAPNHQIRYATVTNNGATVSASEQISDVTWPIINPGGTPDYGDYNENNAACRTNHHYAAWTSQVSPPGVTPASTSLDVFFTVVNDPPTANAGGPYMTAEGTDVGLSGSATDPENDTPFLFEWDLDNDGQFDDATGQTPTFTDVGQDGVFPICLRVTDSIPDPSTPSCTTVTVTNVVPSVVNLGSDSPRAEGGTVTITGTVTDPGWEDPLAVVIESSGGGTPGTISTVAEEHVRPDGTLDFSAPVDFGDNGTYTVRICGHDDDVTTDIITNCANIGVAFDNVDPTADILGTMTINGQDVILGSTTGPTDLTGRSSDPGSDDLTFDWAFGDGDTATSTSLVNPPMPDPPFPPGSPSIQPRVNVDDMQSHTYGDACLYTLDLEVTDDDGGSNADQASVIISANAGEAERYGYWKHQYKERAKGKEPHPDKDLTAAELLCYLEITKFGSAIFDEVRGPLNTLADGAAIFEGDPALSSHQEKLDKQLFSAWLNFANGAFGFDQLIVDTDGDHVADTSFADAVAFAEPIRANLASTKEQLEDAAKLLEKVNKYRP